MTASDGTEFEAFADELSGWKDEYEDRPTQIAKALEQMWKVEEAQEEAVARFRVAQEIAKKQLEKERITDEFFTYNLTYDSLKELITDAVLEALKW